MMRCPTAAIITLFVSAIGAFAQDFSKLQGVWSCQSGCGCSPASPNKYSSISSGGVARNECGSESNLALEGNRLRAKGWGDVGGTVDLAKGTISWDNHSMWTKLSPGAAQLDKDMGYWESRTFYCSYRAGAFPSKEENAPACDDGDSVMFNSLLCREGDARGCNTVKLSQDDDGRFWRSPKRKLMRQQEPSAIDDARALILKKDQAETTFSADHAIGLFIYFGHTEDANAFRRWIRWIDSNERCTTFCGTMPVGTPRYCKNDRCAFRFGDCQTLLLLGDRLNVAVPFCSPNPIAPLPTVTNVAQALKNTYDETLRKLPVQPPGLKLLRDHFDQALKVYQDAVGPVEKLRTKIEALILRNSMFSQLEKAVSARLDARGYSRHNAVAQIMMLQDWGLGNRWMTGAVSRIATEEPLNPFFQYVAHRRDSKAGMLPLIAQECPSEGRDPAHHREQWSWERDTNDKEWKDTMYWDCLFIAAAYRETGKPPPDDDSTEDALRKIFSAALDALNAAQAGAQSALQEIVKLVSNPGGVARREVEQKVEELKHPVEAAKQRLDNVKDVAQHPQQAVTNPVWTLRKLGGF
jgi:hypothetical protein